MDSPLGAIILCLGNTLVNYSQVDSVNKQLKDLDKQPKHKNKTVNRKTWFKQIFEKSKQEKS